MPVTSNTSSQQWIDDGNISKWIYLTTFLVNT